jgi:hypothetical protein
LAKIKRLPGQTRHAVVAVPPIRHYSVTVSRLTKQEQLVLCVVLGLLLTGLAVKTYRAANPPSAASQTANP